jgi:hypothetical protein
VNARTRRICATRFAIVATCSATFAAALPACRRAPPLAAQEAQRAPAPPPANVQPAPPPRPRPQPIAAADALPALSDLPPERRAIQVVGSGENSRDDLRERQVDVEAARARGLTVVDLSDSWAPSVLDGAGYRSVFTALAADRGDGDGQPLATGERNYLELYGIPPALSVLRRRFLIDANGACTGAFDADALLAVDQIRTWGASTEQKELAKHNARAQRLQKARAAVGVDSVEALTDGTDARTARDAKEHLRFEAERLAFTEAEKRLACEGLMDARKHKAGVYDTEMRTAMLDFQQKHAVMDQADIKRATLEALARPPLDNDFSALERALTERAMQAGGFIEDGSVGGSISDPAYPTYLGADGARHRVPDLATMSRVATLSPSSAATRATTSPG